MSLADVPKGANGFLQPEEVEGWAKQGYYHAKIGSSLLDWLMRRPKHDQGDKILQNTLTVWHDGYCWRVSLHWRSAGLVAYMSNEDLDELLLDVDQQLKKESLRWKVSGN